MKRSSKAEKLLEQMRAIEHMERGKLCKMGSRPHYNHQSWQNGRNVVRYVPAAEKAFVPEGIDGYNEFMRLAEQYADEVIKHTRKEQARRFPKKDRRKKTNRPQKPKKGPCKKIDS